MANESLSQGIQYNENNFVFTAENAYPGSYVEQSTSDNDAVRRVERTQAAMAGSDGAGGDLDLVLGKKDGIGGLASVNICRESAVLGTYFVGLSIEPGATISDPCTLSSPGGISISDLVSDSVRLSTLTLANQPTGYAITTANVDAYGAIVATQTTVGQTYTIDNPTNTTASLMFTVINNGSANFNIDPLDGSGATVVAQAGTYFILFWDGATWRATASAAPLCWELTGNAGTNPAVNFIGTTDAQPLVFRTNSTDRMRILTTGELAPSTDNTSGVGTSALRFASMAAQQYNSFVAASDANAGTSLRSDALYLGTGGASALDIKIKSQGHSGSGSGFRIDDNLGAKMMELWPLDVFIGTIAGQNSLASLSTTNHAVCVGYQAGFSLTSGLDITAVGYRALAAMTSGGPATACGMDALRTCTGDFNSGFGRQSGQTVTSGFGNVLLGDTADVDVGTRNQAIVIGLGAIGNVDKGLFFPKNADALATLSANGAGTGNTKLISYDVTTGQVGPGAGYFSTANVALGATAGDSITTAGGCVNIGVNAGTAITSGDDNTNLGHVAGELMTTSIRCTHVGRGAGAAIVTANDQTAVGWNSMFLATASGNTAVGRSSGATIVGGANNCFFGAGVDADTAGRTGAIAIGVSSGGTSASATVDNGLFFHTAIAALAPSGTGQGTTKLISYSTSTGQVGPGAGYVSGDNVALGSAAGDSVTSATGCVNIGVDAGTSITSGSSLTNVGHISGALMTIATNCTHVGYACGHDMVSGDGQTAVGTSALTAATANGNTGVGKSAGISIVGGANNCFFGAGTDANSASRTGAIAIGVSSGGTGASATVDNGLFFHTSLATSAASGTEQGVTKVISYNTSTGQVGPGIGYVSTNSVALGDTAGDSITTASGCVNIGSSAGTAVTSGSNATNVGHLTGLLMTSATNCTHIGASAGKAMVTGNGQTAVGTNALMAATSGGNTAIGLDSGITIVGGVGHNTFVGKTTDADSAIRTGSIAIGVSSAGSGALATVDDGLFFHTSVATSAASGTGQGVTKLISYNTSTGQVGPGVGYVAATNVALGATAGDSISSATGCTSIGTNAGTSISTGNDNTLTGNVCGDAVTTGSQNSAYGAGALGTATTDTGHSAFGFGALGAVNTAATASSAFGWSCCSSITTGNASGFGLNCLAGLTTGTSNAAFGQSAMFATTTGTTTCAFGFEAMGSGVFTGSGCVAVGFHALNAATSVTGATAVGMNALLANTTGVGCTAVGNGALQTISTGTNGTAVGYTALLNCTGSNNTAVGTSAGVNLGNAADNAIVGSGAMVNATTGIQSVAVGSAAMGSGTFTGSDCVSVGFQSLYAATATIDSTCIGSGAGSAITSGTRNTCIGKGSGDTISTGGHNTILGCEADVDSGAALGRIAIGRTSSGVPASATVDDGLFFHTAVASIAAAVAVQYNAATGQMGPLVSSNRFKKDISDMAPEIDSSKIYDLRPVCYNWSVEHLKDCPREFGLIAEEVNELFPTVVPKDKEAMPYSVNYDRLTVLLVAEIKKLRDRIVALENAG